MSPTTWRLARLPEVDDAELALAQSITPVSPDSGMLAEDNLVGGPGYVWSRLLELRDIGLVELEKLRNAGVKNPLDAEAVFQVRTGKDSTAGVLEEYIRELEDMLGVGYARIERVADLPEGVEVHVLVQDTREKYNRCAPKLEAPPRRRQRPQLPRPLCPGCGRDVGT